MRYSWPGNVRELQHTLERAVILSENNQLRPDDFFFPTTDKSRKEDEDEEQNLENVERRTVERALRASGGNMSRAAELL